MKCPKCGSRNIWRSRTRGALERAMKMVGVKHYRCGDCNHRFKAFAPFSRPVGPRSRRRHGK